MIWRGQVLQHLEAGSLEVGRVMQTEQVAPQVLAAVSMPQVLVLVPQVVWEVPELHFERFCRVLPNVFESNPC
jgi:hypothetical protein